MAPPPRELNPDAVYEILLRLPPDNPVDLVRASAVCKPWLRTLTDPEFLRSYRAFHGKPCVLGFLDQPTDRVTRFISTTAFIPHAAATAHRSCDVLDCRHGRVLLYDYGSTEFVVWDPVTGSERRIPDEWTDAYSNHAVLCAAAGAGCDHSTCSGGPFVLASVGVDGGEASACFYSSESGEWRQSHLEIEDDYYLEDRSPTLLGGALYFVGEMEDWPVLLRYNVLSSQLLSLIELRYDVLSSQRLSLIEPPEENNFGSVIVVPAEGSEFGLVSVYRDSLCLWSRETEVGRGPNWVQHRVIDFKKHLPASKSILSSSISARSGEFADGANAIFVRTHDGHVFSIDLNSMVVRKVCEISWHSHIFPYVCFYTPAACARGALPSPVETQ